MHYTRGIDIRPSSMTINSIAGGTIYKMGVQWLKIWTV